MERDSQSWRRRGGPDGSCRLRVAWPLVVLYMSMANLVYMSNAQSDTGSSYLVEANTIGINYGRIADDLPPAPEAVQLMINQNVGRVKLFDSDSTVLNALANCGLEVVIALPNEGIANVAGSQSASDQWVQQNVLAFYPETKIVGIVVGNELFSDTALQSVWSQLLPAIQNIYQSLSTHKLSNSIKVSTAVALDCLATSYPPSAGAFSQDIAVPYLQPLLQYLHKTHSYFYINAYPYFAWESDPKQISLDYALFGSTTAGVADNGVQYTNLLDAQLDAVSAAMDQLGYGDVRLAISETGWPTKGDANQLGADILNAANYNRRLVRKILNNATVGTPRRPGIFIPTYVFALFNEDDKPGPASERNWGILYPNGSEVYPIDMTGQMRDDEYAPLASASPVVAGAPQPDSGITPPSISGTWCVANQAVDKKSMQGALDYACGAGAADCTQIQDGQSCFQPNTVYDHASYAFNSYWQRFKSLGGTCHFDGAATITNQDPSKLAFYSSLCIGWPRIDIEGRRGESSLAFAALYPLLALSLLSGYMLLF